MKKLALTPIIVLLLLGCKKECDSLLPNCLHEKIKDGEIHGSITRYNSSKGHLYEVILGDFSDLLDDNCNVVCMLGGFVGVTDCVNNGDTLELTSPVVVWEE
jgi:hypothetical protein